MKNWMKLCSGSAALAFVSVLALPAASQVTTSQTAVDLELGLVVDVSGSVDTAEFNIQRDGYVAAFRDPAIIDVITQSSTGIAVNLIYFASSANEAISSTLLTDSASVLAFADAIALADRPDVSEVGVLTDIFDGIDLAVSTLNSNVFVGNRVTIDVSGDGTSDDAATQASRDAALASGVTNINGLPIGGQGIADFFEANVIGGDGAFNEPASTFVDFNQAVLNKISAEITVAIPPVAPPAPDPTPNPVPTPGAAAAGLLMLGLLTRRR